MAEEMRIILGNLARPGLDGASLTEEIRNLRQIQEQGWNPSLFEGLMLNSTHLAELKRNPQHYGRLLDDREPVDPARGIHILLDADRMRILELTPFAFSQLMANQARGVPGARMQLTDGIWAFPEYEIVTSPELASKTFRSEPGKTLIPPRRPPATPSPQYKNSLGMTMVRIEPGEFLMGSTKAQIDLLLKQFPDTQRELFDDEQPQHPVRITRPFYLAAHPVTVGQFRRFVETSRHKAGAGWLNPGFAQGDDHPAVNVSHDDAVAFLGWLNDHEMDRNRPYRLPTEAEWEFACRAGGEGLYGSGDYYARLDRVAWHSVNSGGGTHSVGRKEANRFGFCDMLGNVWEWCDDYYDHIFYDKCYKLFSVEDPHNLKKSLDHDRVIRGGSWLDFPGFCRPARRYHNAPDFRINEFGFRVAAVQE